MEKYVAVFGIPAATMQDWMETTDEATRKEQMDQMMADWKTWMEAHAAHIVDAGMGLGKTMRVMKDGISEAKNELNYVMTVQAESNEAAAALFSDNPHVQMIPNAYVDVMSARGSANNS
jgi:hypothetical protein